RRALFRSSSGQISPERSRKEPRYPKIAGLSSLSVGAGLYTPLLRSVLTAPQLQRRALSVVLRQASHARQRRHHRRQHRSTAHNIPRHISERSRRTTHTERALRRRLSRTRNRGLGPFRGHASSPPDSPSALRTSVLSHLMSLATLHVSSWAFSTLAASSSSIGNTLPLSKSYASFA